MDAIEFPPFIYGNYTVNEYLDTVKSEQSDIKTEIRMLVDFINKLAQYPFEDGNQTFLYTNVCCKAIRGLLSLIPN